MPHLFQLSKVSWPHCPVIKKTTGIKNYLEDCYFVQGCRQTRQNENVVNDFFSSITFCRQHEILLRITKVVNKKLWKLVDNKKRSIHFCFSKRQMHEWDLCISQFQTLPSPFRQTFNPSDTNGFGTTSDTRGGRADPPPCYLITPLTWEREIFVRYRFILECLIKDEVDKISFVLSPW